jgi:hypothetical protein
VVQRGFDVDMLLAIPFFVSVINTKPELWIFEYIGFAHMRNYQFLMAKVASFLKPDDKLWIHIFTHKEYAYLFEVIDETD